MNWLIAEDEADIRNLVAMMAQVWGHNPITFDNGQQAWEWLDKVDAGEYTGDIPDFALMDIRMPGRRGNELAQRIRQVKAVDHIPIVLMTAFVLSDEEINRMRDEFGVDGVINKPLPDFEELKSVLDAVIAKKQSEQQSIKTSETPSSKTNDAPSSEKTETPGSEKTETSSNEKSDPQNEKQNG